LVCFTASFPYGNKETYFENELLFLSEQFNNVIIIPRYNPYGEKKRSLPANVKVLDVLLKQSGNRLLEFLKSPWIPSELLREFFYYRVYLNKTKLKTWFISVLGYSNSLNRFKRYGITPEDTILYSYWANCEFFSDKNLE